MSDLDRVEDFIWGRMDEEEYLRKIVAGERRMDMERMQNRVQSIQGELNTRLRQGVEENYPRLLEQVTAIEQLDSAHSHFQHEMDAVAKRADQLGKQMDEQAKRIRSDALAISNLTKIERLLGDVIRCEQLTNAWREENDLTKRAELIAELNGVVKGNDKLRQLKWLQERCLFKREEMASQTRKDLLDQLRSSLRSHNSNVLGPTIKALQHLLESPGAYQKELGSLMDEAMHELDALFLQLSAHSNQERAAKLLPQLSTKLHGQLEQFQLLGTENAQQFARHVGKVISNRVPPNAPYAMRLVQTIYKCLMTHADPVANVIREALNPLKASILSQSLSSLFATIDDTFQQGDCSRDAIIVEKLNAALRAELASVAWDKSLLQEMEANISKALQYVAVKLEQQLQFGEETLRFIGRISKAQTQNYQLLNIAHELARHWPGLCGPLHAVIKPALRTILDQMRVTVSLVLASMHEDMLNPLPAGATSSEYIKEICAHLKVFRQHCAQLKPMTDSLEALPSFLNFCIEQFLLHISLIRPLSADSVDRYVRDLEYLCKNGLQTFNCKYAKLLNNHRQIQAFLQLMPNKFTELQHLTDLAQREQTQPITKANSNSLAVPQWFIANMLICASEQVDLPHDSAGWSILDYVQWFNQHSDLERWRFLRSLLDAYKQSVVAKGATEFVRHFPMLNQLVNNHLYDKNTAA